MTDQVDMTHRHTDGEQAMQRVDDERIDELYVRQFTCTCGFTAAVLTRAADEQPAPRWPLGVESPPPLS